MKSMFMNQMIVEYLKCFFDSFPFGICVVDKDYRIKYCNDIYSHIVEREIHDIINTNVNEIAESIKYISNTIESGDPDIYRRQKYVVNGKERECIINKIPIKYQNIVVGAIILILFSDISEFYSFIKSFPKLNKEFDIKVNSNLEIEKKYTIEDIVGDSDVINDIKNKSIKYSKSDSTILITGESGTGKELFAHSIHNMSSRSKNNFVKVNCAALQDELLISELFGYVEGSFTGAKKGGKKGKFELAHKGTIFLDEVGELSLSMQSKLLNVLQEREIDPIGSDKPTKIDVRVIAATNRNLDQMVDEKKFRLDLYYRLNILKLEIPPLRERKKDIRLITEKILNDLCREFGILPKYPSEEFLQILENYEWKGNVRELNNILIRAIWNSNNKNLNKDDLPEYIKQEIAYDKISNTVREYYGQNLRQTMKIVEKEIIINTLKDNKDILLAAEALGISKRQLYRKIKEFNIEIKKIQ